MKQIKPDYCQWNKAIIKTGQPLSRRRRADALSSAGSSARNKNITHKLKKMGVVSALPTMLTRRELGILLVLNEPVK